MDDSSKVLEYSKMDENGNRLEFSTHKMNMAYSADAASRGLIQKFITAGIIPTELPSAEYNDDGSVFSTFNSDRIPSELLMNAKWREDAEELLILIEKVINKESNLSFLLAARTVESEEDWKAFLVLFQACCLVK